MQLDDRVIWFPQPCPPLSMNDGNTRSEWTRQAAWRDTAYWHWVQLFPGVGPSRRRAPTPAVVSVVLEFGTRRRRDPINFARTVKHIVDGLVMAGAWPDDTLEFVDQQIPTLIAAESPMAPICVVRVRPALDKPTPLV